MQGAKYLETTIFYIGFEHNIPAYQGRANKIIGGQGKCKSLTLSEIYTIGICVFITTHTTLIWNQCLLIFFPFYREDVIIGQIFILFFGWRTFG